MAKGGFRQGAGRKKASHTIEAEAAKARLVELFIEAQEPIFKRLIKDATDGDSQARKELFERVWGKVKDSVDLTGTINHTLDVPDRIYEAIIKREAKRIKISGD